MSRPRNGRIPNPAKPHFGIKGFNPIATGITAVPHLLLAQQCPIGSLPLEMLGQTLSYCTPMDILALARTSKFYCATLTHPGCDLIWKRADCFPNRACIGLDIVYFRSRQSFYPYPIPDPTPDFRESSYAAYLFDSEPCLICAKLVQAEHKIYALRVRICVNKECETALQRKLKTVNPTVPSIDTQANNVVRTSAISSWLRYRERPPGVQDTAFLPKDFSLAEWETAVNEYNQASQSPAKMQLLKEMYEVRTARLSIIMNNAKELAIWRDEVQARRVAVLAYNSRFVRTKSKDLFVDFQDMSNSPTQIMLFRFCRRTLEEITSLIWSHHEGRIVAECARLAEYRERRTTEGAYKRKRADVEAYFHQLNSNQVVLGEIQPNATSNSDTPSSAQKPDVLMPTLAHFRSLPMISVLQKKQSGSSIAQELKRSTVVADMVKDNLDAFRKDTMNKLKSMLASSAEGSGHTTGMALLRARGDGSALVPNNPAWLHPSQRVTALFNCKRCGKVKEKYMLDGAMDLEGVCAHSCLGLLKKKRKKPLTWSVSQFQPDGLAIKAVKEVLRLTNLAEETTTKTQLLDLGQIFACDACPSLSTGPVAFDFRSVVGHVKRHGEGTTIRLRYLLNSPNLNPVQDYHCLTLMGRTKSAERERDKIQFGCRLCDLGSGPPPRKKRILADKAGAPVAGRSGDAVDAVAEPAVDPQGDQVNNTLAQKEGRDRPLPKPMLKQPTLYSFNGLRSHLKAKHAIVDVRDEDFFKSDLPTVDKLQDAKDRDRPKKGEATAGGKIENAIKTR